MRNLIFQFLFLIALPLYASPEVIQYQVQTISINGNQYEVRVPKGYTLEFLTGKLEGPRLFSFSPEGVLFIGSRSGNVYRLKPPYTKPEIFVSLNDYPHSVAFRKDHILIARTGGLFIAEYRPGQKKLTAGKIKRLVSLPGGGGHNSRTVAVGPDGKIYISLGISGNCSDQYIGPGYSFEDRRGGVMVLDESGKMPAWKAFASGLRNPVGFAWHPVTGVMYASNNGPDHHGYDQPPEYFSRLTEGSFHGMPWYQFNGSEIQRDDCIERNPPRPIGEVSKPVASFPARNAPMGVAFVPAKSLGKAFDNDAIVALHGSWGTRPSGDYWGKPASRRPPKLVIVRFENGHAKGVEDFITGFQLQDGKRWARPVGVGIGPDGALYFTSDGDHQGLYRLLKAR